MKHIYTSIDIGSNEVKVVVCELLNGKLNLLATSSQKSHGIKQGLVVDEEEAMLSIKKALNGISDMLGIKIKKVITSIPSYNAKFEMVSGNAKINEVVNGEAITEVLQDAAKRNIKKNMEVITILPIEFTVDDHKKIKEPKGLKGNVLKVKGIMVSTPKNSVLSVVSLIEKLGIEVVEITINPLANINAFRTKQMNAQSGVIIDVGYETTTVSLYNKGIPINNTVIGLGGKNIDNDLSYMYKINLTDANNIKEKFALADVSFANNYETYETINQKSETVVIKQAEASEILASRLEEILNLAKKEIKSLTNSKIDYIIITGGTSNVRQLDNFVDKLFNDKATIGSIKIVGIRNNKYSVALGSVVYFINKLRLKGIDYSMIDEDEAFLLSSVKKGFDVPNDSMLGKVFGYFFGE